MTNEREKPKKSGFGGIFSGIQNMIMTDDYLAKTHAENENTESEPEVVKTELVKQTAMAMSVASVITVPVLQQQSGSDVEMMIKKIYGALEAMNQPGIDFLEIWNAAETMGGINEQNLTSSFRILNIGAGNSLTVEGIVASGNYYIDGLKNQISNGIEQKKADKEKLVNQQKKENESLVKEIENLTMQIDTLGKELLEKKQKLSQLDSVYVKPISDIDQKINVGAAALEQVLNKLRNAITIFSQIKFS